MDMLMNILNILVIVVFIVTYLQIYRKSPSFFGLLLLPYIFWIQLLISSAYIETGIYLIDFETVSYTTGATIRLFLLLEIQLVVCYLMGIKYENKIKKMTENVFSEKSATRWCIIALGMILYLLVDVVVFGSANRFDYYTRTSTLPLVNVVSYFSYPLSFLMGYFLINCKKKKNIMFVMLYLIMTFIWMYLRGVQFGGFLITGIIFISSFVIKLAKQHKLIRIRYIVFASVALLILLIPKYNYYKYTTMYDNIGVFSAYEKLFYRAFGQGADLTWAIDRQIMEEDYIDPGQFKNEISSLFTGNTEGVGVYYLMDRSCPPKVLDRYYMGTAVITGGYPIIWASIFGYLGGIIPTIIDAILFAFLMYRIMCSLIDKSYIKTIMLIFIYTQCYSIVMSSGIYYLGNLIPKIFLFILFFIDILYKRVKIGEKTII